jgi:hypothetical protein
MWYEIKAASSSSFISSVEITDSRRVSLIDRFDDSDSIDSTDCLSLKTIFSWIMIAFFVDDLCKYDSKLCLISFWLIQDNVIEIFLQIIDRNAQTSTITEFWEFFIVSE